MTLLPELSVPSRFISLHQRFGRYTCPYCRKEVFLLEYECETEQETYTDDSVYKRLLWLVPGFRDIPRLAREAMRKRHAEQRASRARSGGDGGPPGVLPLKIR